MRKQELKSRKKVHARKRNKKGLRAYRKKEITIAECRPEVITLEEVRKRTKEVLKSSKDS